VAYRYITSNNPGRVSAPLPKLTRGGTSRSVVFSPGETKKLHEADVRSPAVQKLLKRGILLDVTTRELARAKRVAKKQTREPVAATTPEPQSAEEDSEDKDEVTTTKKRKSSRSRRKKSDELGDQQEDE